MRSVVIDANVLVSFFIDRNDAHVLLNQKFANAWRVTDVTSLFDYAPGTSTASFTNVNWPPTRQRLHRADAPSRLAHGPPARDRAVPRCDGQGG